MMLVMIILLFTSLGVVKYFEFPPGAWSLLKDDVIDWDFMHDSFSGQWPVQCHWNIHGNCSGFTFLYLLFLPKTLLWNEHKYHHIKTKAVTRSVIWKSCSEKFDKMRWTPFYSTLARLGRVYCKKINDFHADCFNLYSWRPIAIASTFQWDWVKSP